MAEIQTTTTDLEVSIPSTFSKDQALETPSTVCTEESITPKEAGVFKFAQDTPEAAKENAEDSFETAAEVSEEEPVAKAVTFHLPSDGEQSDEDNVEEAVPASALITPRSAGISFAQAFSTSPLPTSMSPPLVLKSPRSVSSTSTESCEEMKADTPTSHSAVSASKNKRASDLIAKYQEKIAHTALPGDSVPIKSPRSDEGSPSTGKVLQKKSAQAFVELNSLPDMNSVRDKFEQSSRRSHGKFEFGESFRQKQRYEQLSEQQKKEEAKVSIRGFNEKILLNGKTATAEIDTSNLPKSFTFDLNKCAPVFPNDGICRVDYTNADFCAKVFVVHKTRGMLILQDKHATPYTSKTSGKTKKKRKNTVPGGKISEEEFLAAAKENGSPQVQLQIAAKEAAARLVFEITGLDIRQQADRLKPAILSMTPSMNTARGYENLTNENEEKLYYFLEVDEDDFENLQQGEDAAPSKLTRPSEDAGEDQAPAKLKRPSQDLGDEPLTLKLSSDYSKYEFVPDPAKARKVLLKDGNDAAAALTMILKTAAKEIKGANIDVPDAKATEYDVSDDEGDEECEHDGTVRTVGEKSNGNGNTFHDDEAKLNKSTAGNTNEGVGVSCCCGFW